MLLKSFYWFSLIILTLGSEEELDYYENLINEEIAETTTYQLPTDASEYQTQNEVPKEYGTFDYIIVGGGTAGSLIANRLSEVAKLKILLLEAGGTENNFTDIPTMALLTVNSRYNWGFNSTLKKTCCLDSGGLCTYPRGKTLGGSSVTNFLMHARGNRKDYDEWAARGNSGWSYKDVLPSFIKYENFHLNGDTGYHGYDGNLNIQYTKPINPKILMFLNGSQELGQDILDYNGRSQIGVSRTQLQMTEGRRDSAAKSFLTPALKRKNLTILTQTYVLKILINNGKNAYGVNFSHRNIKYCAKAKKEIILTAGVIGSAHLLMVSGVGPKSELKKHKIPLKMDLPVGKTFHDHPVFRNFYVLTSKPNLRPSRRESLKQYLYSGAGPLTQDAIPDGIGFIYARNTTDSEIEILFESSIVAGGGFQNTSQDFSQSYMDSWNQDPLNSSDVIHRISAFILVVSKAKSVGSITLQSSDPYQYPIIDFPCLEDPLNQDVDNLYAGIKHVQKYLDTEAFKKNNARLLIYRPCGHLPLWSKQYWLCCFRYSVNSIHHGVASCKMGPNSKIGVVDNKLRVYGIKNLRVADAGVIPFNLACHTEAPTLMVAERMADFLLK